MVTIMSSISNMVQFLIKSPAIIIFVDDTYLICTLMPFTVNLPSIGQKLKHHTTESNVFDCWDSGLIKIISRILPKSKWLKLKTFQIIVFGTLQYHWFLIFRTHELIQLTNANKIKIIRSKIYCIQKNGSTSNKGKSYILDRFITIHWWKIQNHNYWKQKAMYSDKWRCYTNTFVKVCITTVIFLHHCPCNGI